MKAIQIQRFGGPEQLKIVSMDRPRLSPNGVRIAVRACGVNFADLMMRMGMYPEAPSKPFTPGYEISGEILELGSDTSGSFQVGERIFAPCKFGGYCDEIVLPENQIRKIPNALTYSEAASIPVTFLTAWVALRDMARVREQDRVLIHGAAGGVGVAATQIAARAGAKVVGIVGSPTKRSAVVNLGATEAWTREEWNSRSGSEKFDIILDPVGGNELKRSYQALAPTGRVISFGMSTAVGARRSVGEIIRFLLQTPLFPPFRLMMDNRGVFGLNLLQLIEPPERLARALDEIVAGFARGEFRTVVAAEIPLEEAGKAHSLLQSRQTIGKVVLIPNRPASG